MPFSQRPSTLLKSVSSTDLGALETRTYAAATDEEGDVPEGTPSLDITQFENAEAHQERQDLLSVPWPVLSKVSRE